MGNFYMLDTYTPDVFSTDVRNVTFCLLDGFSKVKIAQWAKIRKIVQFREVGYEHTLCFKS